MPKRTDLKKIMIIGSGPIIISQACEFDYSGTQAVKALREEGLEVVLVNSNPATIMTDPEMADRTYVEPITPEVVIEVLKAERPDAILPTLGGQTALNTALMVAETGILERLGIEMIAATPEVIKKAESRELFREAMNNIGLRVPESDICRNLPSVLTAAERIGYPVVVRPAFTLGGTGGGVAYNREDLERIAAHGLSASLTHEVMIEESVLGWKEFELEVMRDRKDNVVIICSIENLDPMGVHTGDSITVAPAQTLTDREYQEMRDASIAIMREIGVETGGSNVQFAINPADGEMVVIEMNPRVSRSSALASKATGFPIAKMAAKLAIGYTLDELPNDITKETMASFEPTIDYCVVKAPRWAFEKFPGAEDVLSTAMKSVGETMAIGRTFKEALQKGLRGLEIGRAGLLGDGKDPSPERPEMAPDKLRQLVAKPSSLRIFWVAQALKQGMGVDELYKLTAIDPWFLHNIKQIVEFQGELESHRPWGKLKNSLKEMDAGLMRRAKQMGFSDRQIAHAVSSDEDSVRARRLELGVRHTYKLVDTCAAEFEAYTPYFYSTYETEDECRAGDKRKVMILGGGPNRIGQGIEFDYCCVHASMALREMGIESIMVNSNPETVSTDYDTSDKLYFEPLTKEDVLNIIDSEKPEGIIVQFGGQTPLNLAVPLERAGAPILGTSPDAIDRAEDRDRFVELLKLLNLRQPENGTATSVEGALAVAERIGYPVVVRPSYVLGGRAMEIVYDQQSLTRYMTTAVEASPDHPILVDKFLEDAVEVDVDAVADQEGGCVVAGVMEHIEQAGVHSGDSACVLPPHNLTPAMIKEIKEATYALARELGVLGLMNIQYAVKDGLLYLLEVNPRASRTVPFVSKATGIPWAKVATKVMMGQTLAQQGITEEVVPKHYSVKEAVFPFVRFPGVDPWLGPEMRSTGEVMGIDRDLGLAFAKSQLGASQILPTKGKVFISVKDADKPAVAPIAAKLHRLGFDLLATTGTHAFLSKQGIECRHVFKVSESRPHVVDAMVNGEIDLVINTTEGKGPASDAYLIRRTALERGLAYCTTLAAARATADAVEALLKNDTLTVTPLQDYYAAG
ncbi:MAG: carbamoyl-phosphate synthase large subunit [Desulfarculus sp.]|nr:carbamoyl-phosphate synthase large subunit [Pseudomonadota bacterium]MBV1716102.1 carbamoyl-phosphate synthase large subunit [Desulfarculus sp.]MBU4574825.1 carbamoyl-phosphate synthase large subunit [Pseudomonadota bacterium]MBU4596382.1 carbamoyl-phosphate synthase large subunit [Pseudomonadota bacterium]MBV1738177.1 carbamoyl-phosphate synthase large subunit [Desulfarculus sp.]